MNTSTNNLNLPNEIYAALINARLPESDIAKLVQHSELLQYITPCDLCITEKTHALNILKKYIAGEIIYSDDGTNNLYNLPNQLYLNLLGCGYENYVLGKIFEDTNNTPSYFYINKTNSIVNKHTRELHNYLLASGIMECYNDMGIPNELYEKISAGGFTDEEIQRYLDGRKSALTIQDMLLVRAQFLQRPGEELLYEYSNSINPPLLKAERPLSNSFTK